MKFTVVNPVTTGSFKTEYDGETPEAAAKAFWEALTTEGKYITGNVPKFLFSIMENEKKTLYHFVVTETPDGNTANFSIEQIDPGMSKDEAAKFIEASEKAREDAKKMMAQGKQEGGKHRRRRYEEDDDDSSSSSSSSDDIDELFKSIRIKRVTKPIVYWWYTPTIYKYENLFVPTFASPVTPYVQLYVPMP